ncbi:MAG: DNA-3-methyladenine glycosylase I [Holosporales bacterium]
MNIQRCPWCLSDPLYQSYHDNEWGQPLFDNKKLFSLLCLEGAQAGLSWWQILKRRESYEALFDDFEPSLMASYTPEKIAALAQDARIIRSRKKVEAFVINAQAYMRLSEKQTFSDFLWNYVEGRPLQNAWREMGDVPTTTPLAIKMTKDLKKAGFTFVGPSIIYAFMQAAGMVNDHLIRCYRHAELAR